MAIIARSFLGVALPAAGPDPRLGALLGVEEIPDQFVPDGRCQAREQLARIFSLLVQSQTDAQPELGVVFEQGVGPRGAAALAVDGPGGGRQGAAVDRRDAGGGGDDGAVTEEL